jgi:2-succinyl-5-enolpyruvyl-6-hydroxy-3-cyclohexene-1-carboxylate synthase
VPPDDPTHDEPADPAHDDPAHDDPAPDAGVVAATYCATLVDEWVALGLTDAVVAPGSRSTPLALAVATDERVRVHVVVDERSAAFTALGLGLATGHPALLVCTSGTAAAEFHAAVVEAHQAAVPLLVATADRPPELRGTGAPQTIDQRDLYGRAVRWYCEPGPPELGGAPWWRDLAADAWGRCLGATPGPVHLNLAFREPLLGDAGPLPPPRQAERPRSDATPRWGLPDEELGRLAAAASGRRGVVVAGARAAGSGPDADALHDLARRLGWPLVADAPSGCRDRGEAVTALDALLRVPGFAEAHRPEVVLRFGGLLASRLANEWLAASGALQVGVDRHGVVPDPDRVLQRQVAADPAEVARGLAAAVDQPAPGDWLASWRAAEERARAAIGRVLSRHPEVVEPTVATEALLAVPDGGALVVSSSMPVRDLEWYAPPRAGVRVLANRGANGIDGVTSTAVGVALTGVPTVLLTGDLAFLHDAGALVGLARRRVALVVVVVDNDGGGIFHFLPQRTRVAPERFEALFGTPHGTDLVALCRAHGVPAERVATRSGLRAALAGATTRGGIRVVVAASDREANVALHAELHAAVTDVLADPSG